MSDHFIGIVRGNVGYADNQFTYGTSSATTAVDLELRIADVDANSHAWTRGEIHQALEALETFLTTPNPHISGTEFPII